MVSNLCNFIHQMSSRCDKTSTRTNFKFFTADSSPILIKIIFTAHTLHMANAQFCKLIIMLPFQDWHCILIKKQSMLHTEPAKKSQKNQETTSSFPSCRQCLMTRAVELPLSILSTSRRWKRGRWGHLWFSVRANHQQNDWDCHLLFLAFKICSN